jgi:glycosyltransferase involved in cell wall biosynthesis
VERFERKVPRHRTVIYNGIDVSNYGLAKPGKRPRLELLTVGALAPRKGQQFVIEALDSVRDAGIDARLTMVGSGPDEALLRELVNRLGLADSVVFAGEHLDPRPFLVEADIFVLPSRQEGFSNALLEAMASGLPAVVTDVGGNREALDGQGGRIVEPEQSDRLAEAILGLARTRGQLAELGGYNRARAAATFSIQQSVRHLAEWYLTGPSSG